MGLQSLIATAAVELAIPQAANALKDLFVNLRIILCRFYELGILIQRKPLIGDGFSERAAHFSDDAIMLSRRSSGHLIKIFLLESTDTFEGSRSLLELLFCGI